MSNYEIPLYKEHKGTIKIAGTTFPKDAGKCAYKFFTRGMLPIDFMCIGASANQQATKSMGVFFFLVRRFMFDQGISISFQPYRFQTRTIDSNKEVLLKDCTVWRTVILKLDKGEKDGWETDPL